MSKTKDKPALVLVNLGTPKTPTTKDVRSYLREFLSDRRVIETHPLIWRPILEGIILRIRPAQSAEKYRSVWLNEGSPLLHYTTRQAELIQEQLGGTADVRVAMRYGEPHFDTVLTRLHEEGYKKVAVLPAYPQYSATTVGSINDVIATWIHKNRDHMEIRMVRSFPDAEAYIGALADAIEQHWELNGRPNFAAGDRLLASFHSIPLAMHTAGDPYKNECDQTITALRNRLNLPEEALLTTYQSVFGPAKWLAPATIDTVEELGAAQIGRVDVICPGFMADCLETLEEINQLNRETFTEAGGQEFHYITWGNDSDGAVRALVEQAEKTLAGWI